MILERALEPSFVSNTYLVGDREGGSGFFLDAGGPVEELLAAARSHRLEVTHILLTHHHFDHVSELGRLRAGHPRARVLAHPLEAELIEGEVEALRPGAELRCGELSVRALHTPGHTAGMLSFLVEGPDAREVFTGDTLFKGSVGGVRAPGHTTFADLRSSIMDTLMGLDHDTVVRPGHTDPTSIGAEWESNPFVRLWRGLDEEGEERCTALGEPARLVLLATDYDGGHKAWVRWEDGSDDIVPGSQVERG